MIYSDNTYDIINGLATYHRRDFKQIYDKQTKKWYMLNNLNEYEEYGIYGSGLNITTYKGKLTIDNDIEYKWNGNEWIELGSYVMKVIGCSGRQDGIFNINGSPFILNNDCDTRLKLRMLYDDVQLSDLSGDLLISTSTGDKYEYELFTTYKAGNNKHSLCFDLGASTYRAYGPWHCTTDVDYDIFLLNQNGLFAEHPEKTGGMRVYVNDELIASKSSRSPNANTKSTITFNGSKRAIFRSIEIKKTNGEHLLIEPRLNEETGYWTYYDTISNTFMEVTLYVSGLTPVYDYSRPEEYETKVDPTEIIKSNTILYNSNKSTRKLIMNDTEIKGIIYNDEVQYKKFNV